MHPAHKKKTVSSSPLRVSNALTFVQVMPDQQTTHISDINLEMSHDIALGQVLQQHLAVDSQLYALGSLVLAVTDPPRYHLSKERFFIFRGILHGGKSFRGSAPKNNHKSPQQKFLKSEREHDHTRLVTVTPPFQDLAPLQGNLSAAETAQHQVTSSGHEILPLDTYNGYMRDRGTV